MDHNSFYPRGLSPITLQHQTNGFFEMRVDEKNFRLYFAEGKLENGKPVPSSIERFDQEETSLSSIQLYILLTILDEALNLVNELINTKLDAGFELVEADYQDAMIQHEGFNVESFENQMGSQKHNTIRNDAEVFAENIDKNVISRQEDEQTRNETTQVSANKESDEFEQGRRLSKSDSSFDLVDRQRDSSIKGNDRARANVEELKLEEEVSENHGKEMIFHDSDKMELTPEEEKVNEVHGIFKNQLPLNSFSFAPAQQVIPISSDIWDYIDQIDRKAQDLQISYEPAMNSLNASGSDTTSLNYFAHFIHGLQVVHKVVEEERKSQGRRLQDEAQTQNDVFIQKELKLCSSVRTEKVEIAKMAESLGLIYENLDDKVLVAGLQKSVFEFVSWIYDFTAMILELEIQKLKEAQQSDLSSSDYCQDRIYPSTFHRAKKDVILQKADEMDVVIDFGYDLILASATKKNLAEFKSYLHEVEATAKKALYPKYWDFDDINAFSETVVSEFDEEFHEVSNLFYASLKNAKIEKLTRIQNKYLMDHYITMLQKRQELRSESTINRKLLFHGTRNIQPHQIYKSSDTGFDLQYSNPNGAYGKGLYFAMNSNYSHNGYTFNMGNGRFQMFLADVFVGNAYKSGPNNKLVKAPEGYDSVEGTSHGFHILYNNFHSYPLYLIEYTIQGNSVNNAPSIFKGFVNPMPVNNGPQLFSGGANNMFNGNQNQNANNQAFNFGNIQPNNSGGLFLSSNLPKVNSGASRGILSNQASPFFHGNQSQNLNQGFPHTEERNKSNFGGLFSTLSTNKKKE